MAEPVRNFKLIVGSISVDDSWGSKSIDKPVYFDTLEEAKTYLSKRKTEIEKVGMKIWFYKVWEFGKQDYKDMGDNLLGI